MKTEIIEKLIKLNKKAFKNKEVPVSCVIVKNNKLISKAYNSKIKKHLGLFRGVVFLQVFETLLIFLILQ